MANKTLQTRIQHKIDSYANWIKADPVLKNGELGIVIVPADTGVAQTEPTVLMKIGDGTNKFSALGWTSGLAADVYTWAKAAKKPSYSADEIAGLSNYISGQIQDTDTQYKLEADADNARKFYLYSKTKGGAWGTTPVSTITIPVSTLTTGTVTLAGAPTADLQAATKKYVDDAKTAAVSAAASDASTKASAAQSAAATDAKNKADQALKDAKAYTDTKTAGLTGAMHFKGAVTAFPPTTGTYASGDVLLYGKKEYVYDGEAWHELGDEGSHVLNTQKINGHALSGDITLTAADVGAAVASDITNAINALDVASVGGSGKYIQSISETDGKISATAASLPTALKNPNALTFGTKTYDGSAAATITAADLGAVTDISGKQDKLTFDGTYNASTNKAATVATVTNAINALDVADDAVAGQVVSAVKEENGKIAVSRRALVAADIPTIGAAKVSGLAAVATSGKIEDLTQDNYIIIDCGTATTVI